MIKKTVIALSVATLATSAVILPAAVAKAASPAIQIAQGGCNPCATKACGVCNPCKVKASACNPCAAKNPCNPCNPCAAKNPCNPCKSN